MLTSFLQKPGLAFADVLPDEKVQVAFDDAGAYFAQEPDDVYTPPVTLWAFLSQVISKDEMRSCAAAVTRAFYARQNVPLHRTGMGPLYQGRFKSFPVQAADHFLTVCRYVERNASRANLVERAEAWRWSRPWHRMHGSTAVTLDAWPVPVGSEWLAHVNRAETEAELKALRRSVVRGTPFGDDRWQERTAKRIGLESTLRRRGRHAEWLQRKPIKRHPTHPTFFISPAEEARADGFGNVIFT